MPLNFQPTHTYLFSSLVGIVLPEQNQNLEGQTKTEKNQNFFSSDVTESYHDDECSFSIEIAKETLTLSNSGSRIISDSRIILGFVNLSQHFQNGRQ